MEVNLNAKGHKKLQSSSDRPLLIMASHLPLEAASTDVIDNNKAYSLAKSLEPPDFNTSSKAVKGQTEPHCLIRKVIK